MGRYISHTWHGNPHALRPRDRRSGRFDAYIPHPVARWQPWLPADVAAFIADAEHTLADTASRLKPRTGGDICFWAESLGSSRIEGVAPGTKRVVRALAKRSHSGNGEPRGSVAEVIGNIDATTQAQQLLADRQLVSVQTLLDAHRTLMNASPTPHLGGVVRTEQNWIGGNDWHPLDAQFVPPPPEMCQPLLRDLVAYLRSEDHSPLLQAAVAHAQFETIHPFGDGNGRTGRAVLYGVLKQRCAPDGTMPPISLALSRNRDDYLDALADFQTYVGAEDDYARTRALVRWLEVLSTAAQQASTAVLGYQKAISTLQQHWWEAVGGRKRRSVAAAVIDYLPANPSVTARTLANASRFSERRCGDALRRLEAAGVVKGRTAGPSLRVYEADKVFEAFEVMSSTVCDPEHSDSEYSLVLANPLLGEDDIAASARQGLATNLSLCTGTVKSTGLPCGLVADHDGFCRHLPHRKKPPQRKR